MRRPRFPVAPFALAALSCSCDLFHRARRVDEASPSPTLERPTAPPTADVARLDPLRWKPLDDPSFIGLPEGCALGTVLRRAALPEGSVRFFSPPNGSELVMAVDVDGNDAVEKAGIVDAGGTAGAPFPWRSLSAPPVVARSSTGLVAFRALEAENGKRSAVLWAASRKPETLVEGDRLDVVDAACSGTTCGLLTSLASQSAGPGATLLVGDAGTPASTWKRTDLSGEDQSWAPFSVLGITNDAVSVALSGKGSIGVWSVKAGISTRQGTIDTPLGAYDVLPGEVPAAVAPGESIDTECKKDGFPVKLVRADGKTFEVDGHVPPDSVVSRRLEGGFVVAWLSPTRCRVRSRQMVRAFLVGSDGAPRSSTMAVAEADGFALSTHGSDLDLWLADKRELVWIKGSCRIAGLPNGGR